MNIDTRIYAYVDTEACDILCPACHDVRHDGPVACGCTAIHEYELYETALDSGHEHSLYCDVCGFLIVTYDWDGDSADDEKPEPDNPDFQNIFPDTFDVFPDFYFPEREEGRDISGLTLADLLANSDNWIL